MSASPAPSDVEAGQNGTDGESKKIMFRFCRECSNMLFPKEDHETDTLMFACRTCKYSEPATTGCVYRNDLSQKVGATAGITQDVGADPTVGVPEFCTFCGQEIFCEICGQEKDMDLGYFLEAEDEDAETAMSGSGLFPPQTQQQQQQNQIHGDLPLLNNNSPAKRREQVLQDKK